MKKNNEQLKIMVPIILVAVILTIGIVRYITGMQRAIWQQAVSEILEVTSQGSHAFEVYIEKDMQILSKVVKNLSKEKSKDEAAIRHVVEVFEIRTDENCQKMSWQYTKQAVERESASLL